MSSESPRPDVSVVIPTHNRVPYLKKAIASCFEGNDGVDVEVIVVNDGSSDNTRSYLNGLENPRVRPIHQSSKGAQVARNKGLKAATGRYVKFLDDDDWLISGSLVAEVECLDASSADAAHGRLQVYEENEDGSPSTHLAPESLGADAAATVLRESMWTVPHKYLFRRDSIRQCTWDPSLPYHQDYAFLIDVSCRGLEFAESEQVVGIRRKHEGPRIADAKTAASRTDYYTLKVDLIQRGIRLLEENGLLQKHHRQAAADGIWTWAHIVAGYDLNAFESFYATIKDITPSWTPDRTRNILSVFDKCMGVRRTERLCYPFRRAKNTLL